MIVIGLLVLGAAFGALSARRRKGNRLDMLQYSAGYGMAFAVVGMILTVLIDRMV